MSIQSYSFFSLRKNIYKKKREEEEERQHAYSFPLEFPEELQHQSHQKNCPLRLLQ
jgi:hypothetical protein